MSAAALMASPHGARALLPRALKVAGPARVDDFLLADQNLFGRQLYRMGQDKAVVAVTYASADKQLHADAPALMALKAAYADKGVEVMAVDSRLGDRLLCGFRRRQGRRDLHADPLRLRATGRRGAGGDPRRRGDRHRSAQLDHRLSRPGRWGQAGAGRPGRGREGGADQPRGAGPADRLPGARQGGDLSPRLPLSTSPRWSRRSARSATSPAESARCRSPATSR